MWGCFENPFVNDTSLDPRPLPSLHMRRLYSALSWDTGKQVFERNDTGHSISYAISRHEKRGLHKWIARFPSPRRADTWFPSLPPPPKECTGWRTLTSQPKFRGWMVYQIFLAMGLRPRAGGRQELRYNFPSPNVNSSLRKRLIASDPN